MSDILSNIINKTHLNAYDKASRFDTIDVYKILVYIVDTVQADVLPLLAEQFDVLGFKGMDNATTDKEKRALIKNAIKLKRHLGTPWAIEEAIKTLGYIDPVIVEHVDHWADFSVILDVGGREMTAEETNKIIRIINYYKNTRSRLKELRYKKNFEDGLNIEDEFTYPDYNNINDQVTISGTLFHNGAVRRNGQWVYNSDTDVLNITINNV